MRLGPDWSAHFPVPGSCRHPKHHSKLSLLFREPAGEANHTARRVEIISQQAGTTCVVPPVLGQHHRRLPAFGGNKAASNSPQKGCSTACSLPAHSHLL